jgi:hypothetical protein
MLRDDKLIAHEPTRHPQFEELVIGKVRFKTHDLGDHKSARKLWKTYFAAVEGIVFLCDSSDHARFAESREELALLLSDDSLAKVPFLVLGNKVDKPGAVSEDQLKMALGIVDTTGKGNGVPQGGCHNTNIHSLFRMKFPRIKFTPLFVSFIYINNILVPCRFIHTDSYGGGKRSWAITYTAYTAYIHVHNINIPVPTTATIHHSLSFNLIVPMNAMQVTSAINSAPIKCTTILQTGEFEHVNDVSRASIRDPIGLMQNSTKFCKVISHR